MSLPAAPAIALLLVTASLALGIAGVAWQRRNTTRTTPATRWFVVMMLAVALYAAVAAAEVAADSLAAKRFWSTLEYVGSGGAMLGFLLFALAFAERTEGIPRRVWVLIVALPVANLLLVATHPWHGWIWVEVRWVEPRTGLAVYEHGPGFFWVLACGYGYVIAGWMVLARLALGPAVLRRRQAGWIALGPVIPLLGATGYALGLTPATLNITPIAFLASGLIYFGALFHKDTRVFDLAPLARDQLIEHMDISLVLLDPEGRILDRNPAAADLLGVELRHLGVPIDHVVGPPLAPLTHAQRPDTRRAGETIRLQPVAGRWLDISRLDVTHSGGVGQGRLLLARDVTAQQRLETELRETNRQLTERVHEVTRLHHALYDASIRDRLTGLLNRHYAEEQLDRWLREGNGPTGRDRFALILVDIDHFKGVNDRYGHPAGDRVLKRVGEVLTRCSPADAVIARWGGEEFLVLFPSPSVPEAETCAQAIRGGIRAARTGYHSGWIAVTASIGVALFPEHGTTPEGLFKAADDALYRAKATGRDRVRNAS